MISLLISPLLNQLACMQYNLKMLNNYDNNLKHGISLKNNFYKKLLFFTTLCLTTNLLTMHITHIRTKRIGTFKPYNSLDTWNSDGETPLFVATKNGYLPAVNKILADGANPNLSNQNTDRPLINAIENKNVEIALALINAGADPTLCAFSDDDTYFPEDMLHSQMSMSPEHQTITNDFKVIVPIHSALLRARLKKLKKLRKSTLTIFPCSQSSF